VAALRRLLKAKKMSRHPVYSWPENRALAVHALKEKRLAVISIATQTAPAASASHEAHRAQIRMQLRVALTDVLSTFLECVPEDIDLTHTPGQAPKRNLCLSMPEIQIGISISHEQGLSIAAIYLDDDVGADLVLIDTQIEWQAVAELYLGAQLSAEIAKIPALQQAAYFLLQWASFEARLKCCQHALTEWSPELERALNFCAVQELDLPRGYAGVLALRGS
jgi:4'-phosphopantetheinyl transferase